MNLDREDFRQWLAAKEPNEVVGVPDNPLTCPGGSWLASLGLEAFTVNTDAVHIGGRAHSSLSWLSRFAASLDQRHEGHSLAFDGVRIRCHSITAKEALTILDEEAS